MDNAPVGKDTQGKDLLRLGYALVTPVNNVIESPGDSIVWHIAASGDYWTLYNAAVEKYDAATTAKNQLQMLASGTDDKSLWTVTVSNDNKYEFENKARAAGTNPGNKYLRNNGTNGFACYSSSTGGALSLYKKGNGGTTALDEAAAAHKAIKRIENGQIIIIRDGKRFNAIGARIE
jgi:hypothetical protein